VKGTSGIPEPMLTGRQFPKVLCSLGNDVVVKLKDYSTGLLGIDSDIELKKFLVSLSKEKQQSFFKTHKYVRTELTNEIRRGF